MYGLPSLQNVILIVTIPVLIGLAFVNWRETWYNVTGLVFLCVNTFFAAHNWMQFALADWKRSNDDGDAPKPPVRDPLKYRDLNHTFANETYSVSLDVERNFFAQLLDLRRKREEYKLTEGWWWKSGRWEQCGGASLKQLQWFLQDCERRGLLAKKSNAKNSTRREANMRAIVEIAHGRKAL